MRFFNDTDRYIPLFDGKISYCRAIDDHLIVFDRSGNILCSRICDKKLRSHKNFFELTSKIDEERVVSLCTSFEIRHIAVNTKFGCAIVFTELFGISGLLFAVIPFADKKWVFEYLKQETILRASLSDEAAVLSVKKQNEKEIQRVKSVVETAERAISCVEITVAKYSFGASIGRFLAERILIGADFVGCIGNSRSELDVLPNLTNFSAELFNVFSLIAVIFAREHGKSRSFNATVGETHGHLWVSFCIETDERFTPYKSPGVLHNVLEFCNNLAEARDIIFDVIHNQSANRLTLSFTPESDPFINRVIKQNIRDTITAFWENAL